MKNAITRDEIIARVNRALIEEFELEPDSMSHEETMQGLGLDSLDYIDMIIVLENEFGFRLEDKSVISDIRSLNDVYDFIENIASRNENTV